jgi:multiple sugar transport system substrate-binding protein
LTRPGLSLALLLLAAIPGCGRPDAGPRPVRLSYVSTPAADAVYRGAVEQFRRARPDVPVALMPITGRDYYGKVLVLLAARETPDVIWMGQGFGEFAQRGVFLDIEDRVRREPALAPPPDCERVVGWYRAGGRLRGYPFGVDMDFIAYDEELFDQAGVPYPRDDWTLDDFIRTAQRLTRDTDGDGEIDVWGFRGGLDFPPFGATLLTADQNRANVTAPEMASFLRFNLDLVDRWKVSPRINIPEVERTDSILAFQAGKVAMIYSYTFFLPDLREKLAGRRWDIAPPPAGVRRAHWASSQGYCIARDSANPDAAWELMRYLLTSDALLTLGRRCYPVNPRLWRRILADNRERPQRLDVLENALPYLEPFPRVPHLTEVLADYYDACQRVYGRRAAPEAAMQWAAAEMDATLARRH